MPEISPEPHLFNHKGHKGGTKATKLEPGAQSSDLHVQPDLSEGRCWIFQDDPLERGDQGEYEIREVGENYMNSEQK